MVLGHGNIAEVDRLVSSLNYLKERFPCLLGQTDCFDGQDSEQKNKLQAVYKQVDCFNDYMAQAYMAGKNIYEHVIKTLGDAIERENGYELGHSNRVAAYAERVGRALGWEEKQILFLRHAAILHDVGKIGIPQKILGKPGKLSPIEYSMIKLHSEIGYEILRRIKSLAAISHIVLQHHEQIDGKGYPQGLIDQEISPLAKVLAVVDAYDAMTSARPYKQPMTKIQACLELTRCAETQFDSQIVEVFQSVIWA